MTSEGSRPRPHPSADSQPYWDGAKRHELMLPFCRSCSEFFFYPRAFCPRDFSWDIEWRRVSGRGVLHAFTIIHRAFQPGFDTPYVTALVQLEEGVRLMANLLDVEPDPAAIEIGMPVEVVFENLDDQWTIPQFKPAR